MMAQYGEEQLQALGQMMGMINQSYGAAPIMGMTNALYQNWRRSPAFHSSYNEVLRGATGAQYRVRGALRRSGAPGSGVSSIARGIAPALGQMAMAPLFHSGWMGAQNAALQSMGQRSSAASYMAGNIRWPDPNQPSTGERILGYGMAGAAAALPWFSRRR